MLSEKKNTVNLENIENEQINNSMREIDNQNNNRPRGFNIFLAHGVSPNELRTLRVIYHLSYIFYQLKNYLHLNYYQFYFHYFDPVLLVLLKGMNLYLIYLIIHFGYF